MARKLRQIKGYLWNGNLHDGQLVIDDLVADLEECETASEITKVLQKAANDILTYISNCAWMIPNYAERRRYGERVSTGFVESTVNTVLGMLQPRTRTLDGTLRKKIEEWYPRMNQTSKTARAA